MKKSELVSLRQDIAKRVDESRETRKRINASSGMAKWTLWNEKRAIGAETRVLLLAYSFMRGVPYRVVEPTAKTPEGRTPEGWLKSLAVDIVQETRLLPVDVEAVKTWLAVPEAPERAEARRLSLQVDAMLRLKRSAIHRKIAV